jgi:YD repeat-containing protein
VGYTTTYEYNDPLDRLTKKVSALGKPEEAHTTYGYTGAYANLTQVNEYRDQNTAGDGLLRSDTIFDGFGRVIETRTHEGGAPYIVTTQTYDALGRVVATTNPSRPGDNLGYATTYMYDPLGRQTKVTYPDGSFATTGYIANRATVTDPAGNVRVSTTDSFGRLTSVVEDPGGLNYTTTYAHDPLNDLTQVNQNVRHC